ncbi:hypothetical protein ACJX0J_019248, partial [Zea mays]
KDEDEGMNNRYNNEIRYKCKKCCYYLGLPKTTMKGVERIQTSLTSCGFPSDIEFGKSIVKAEDLDIMISFDNEAYIKASKAYDKIKWFFKGEIMATTSKLEKETSAYLPLPKLNMMGPKLDFGKIDGVAIHIRVVFISIHHMFGRWMEGIWFKTCAFCWAIWLCRNDVIFNNAQVPTPLQIQDHILVACHVMFIFHFRVVNTLRLGQIHL